MKPKNLVLYALVIGSLLLFSGTQINPLSSYPSNLLDSFPPPENLWVDTLACIAYWDEPAGDSVPDLYFATLGYWQPWDVTYDTSWDIPWFLEYGTTHEVNVWAKYGDSLSAPATDTFTSGYLPIPENLQGLSLNDSIEISWQIPYRPDTTPSGSFPYWVHSNFPCAGIPNEYGVETDGMFIYTTQSNGNLIFRYDIDDEILIDSFSIKGVSNIRDLAYNDDNGLFYGGDGSHTCYEMDFSTVMLLRTFTAPVEIQAIAWDEVEEDGLWACSWSSDIMLFDLSGNLINSIPNPSMNFTGLAYDIDSDGGPFLWGFTDHYGGADLVKIAVYPGNIVGNMSVYPRVGGSGPPGGLFVVRSVFVPAATTLGGILQNDRIFGLEIFNWNGIAPPMVPPNLLGYTLYVNEDSLDYIPFAGEDTTVYYDTNSYPFSNYIEYEVTALYDMEPYGMPGDTGESYPEGPAYVYYQMYSVLPFEENWTSGTFAMNEWENDDNWEVIGQIGNPEPCARFQGDLMTNNYSSKLTSILIDGIGSGTPYIDGEILINFDLKLQSSSQTGNEILQVNILTEEDSTSIIQFSNVDGSFDWQPVECYFTNQAFGKMFRIQFEALGNQSSDIQGWYLDNIYVYWYCPEPTNLNCIEITPGEYLLSWKAPDYEPPSSLNENRDIVGYNIYVDNDFLDFTVDTFYFWHPTASGNLEIGVSTLYEDCESYPVDTVVSVTLGIYEYMINQLFVYPNPSQDFITIESTIKCMEIMLFNKLGKLVLQEQVTGNRMQVNTSNLEAGVYVVQVVLESGEVTSRKVVIYR